MQRRGFSVVALMVFFTLALSAARGENWPAWRGPRLDGISQEKNLPFSWDEKTHVLWSLPMPGMGGSTPVIWEDRMFLTSVAGEDQILLCVSTQGKELWRKKMGAGGSKVRSDEGNGASASCSTDGKKVWAFTGAGKLACFDFQGKEIWAVDLQERYGKFKIQFGMHSTPVLHEDRLYLALIHSGGAKVACLEKETGKEVWKIDRKSDGRDECEHSYASPTLWSDGKNAILIVHGNDYATGHSLNNGEEIWRLGGLNPKEKYNTTLRFVASPVAVPGLIVIPSAKNGPVVGLKPDARGMVTMGNSFEQWRRPANTPDVPSPLVHDGLVYLCRENGILICLEAATGKELYQQRTHDQRHRASPVYADGKIFLSARDGTVTVVKAGPKFEVLSKNKLPVQLTASPAISNGRIYLRGFETLYAIGEK
ncbi:MAG: pyrrolo-quinoline quinone [Gemmataceae bacterium]|nr:pyrrolo-quinoline quinone [Gemmataceae bacterium]